MWEDSINIYDVKEIRARSTIYLGVGAIKKIEDIAKNLKETDIDRVLIMTGKSAYKSTGAWDHVENALKNNGIEYILYDKVTPNPTTYHVDEAVAMGREFGAHAVIGIGGGSPIDAAKSAAILLEYTEENCRSLYEFKFTPIIAAPVIAINLTHGTGTEADRFAVVTIPENEYKPAIAYDCIYPLYSIDDPQLMVNLPENQSIFVSVDAVNHAIEASTTKVRSPFSIVLAKETVRLVTKYLPKVINSGSDLSARYFLTYASLIAGISFDNGLLHFTHALEHPLSGVKHEVTHGLGLAVLLPAIVKQIYPAVPEVLADVLSPMLGGARGVPEEAGKAMDYVRQWLRSVRVNASLSSLGFDESSVDKLTKLAFETPSLGLLLSMAPIDATEDVVRQIYIDSL